MTGFNVSLLIACIFVYYFIATILPIDKIIGRLYPIFGVLLLFMTFGVLGGLIFNGYELMPNPRFHHQRASERSANLAIAVHHLSCGAISGFHSTQSPLMARCMRNEKHGRPVFFGAMIVEGIIALIWVAAGVSFYENSAAMQTVIAAGSPAAVVNEVCNTLLGPVGGFLAILGVIVLPITSGDTAFRSTRLILAETFKLDQAKIAKRLLIALPLFAVAFLISQVPFATVWRYFGWSNQTLSMLVLWSAAIWLARNAKLHWIATVPAVFMTAVVASFILQAQIGFGLPADMSNIAGIAISIASLIAFLVFVKPSGAVRGDASPPNRLA